MAQNKFSFWNKTELNRQYKSAVSLHSHTNHSKESLLFIPEFTRKHPILRRAPQRQTLRSTIPVDLDKANWTSSVHPKAAFEVEGNQTQVVLGLLGLVSLTDHDTIEAPALLRTVTETKECPLSLDWTVPFGGVVFHLGIHNLPSCRARQMVSDLASYTKGPSDRQLSELLTMLNQCPEVLIILKHPLWDLGGVGQQRYEEILDQFLCRNVPFMHAFELNATRSRIENDAVIALADRWQRLLVFRGDRHGREPRGALTPTHAETFLEFVREIRAEQCSHVVIIPHDEPLILRILLGVLDVIREYPEYAPGCGRWDDRVSHSHQTPDTEQPISARWNAPPACVEQIFSIVRRLENTFIRSPFRRICQNAVDLPFPSNSVSEAVL